jgi:hypothetical protein
VPSLCSRREQSSAERAGRGARAPAGLPWLDKLLIRLAGDEIALGKIELMRDGIDDAAVQAERLGCSVADIYRANERIAYHASIVKRAARKETDSPDLPEARP